MNACSNRLAQAVARALGTGLALSLTAVAAQAQQQQPQKVEKIEVTGTNIKRVDTEPPGVVQVITKEQIERSGTNNVAEVLRAVPALAGGAAQDFGAGTGFQRGNQTASIRGLGSVATLVLLNGRRVSPAPYADPNLGQGSSYNLNSIPVAAIERIEILKDGASAIYGSDAIAGVVNVILRKDYRGGEVSFNHWQNWKDGNYEADQFTGTIGFGDLSTDRWNLLVTAELVKRDPVWVRDAGDGIRNADYARLASRNIFSSALSNPANRLRESIPGSGVFNTRLAVDPACPAERRFTVGSVQECRYNPFDFIQTQSENERKSVMGRATFEVSPSLTAFAEAGYSKNESVFTGSPPTLDAASPSTWFNRDGTRFRYTLALPVGHPDNPNAFATGLRYRFEDLGTSYTFVDNEYTRIVGGLQGTFGNWDWEAGVLYSVAKREETSNGQLYFPALQAAVNNGTYRFGGTNTEAVLSTLAPYKTNEGESKLTSVDFKASRELFKMAGGSAAIAAGVEFRKEEMNIVSDPRIVAGEFVGLASSTVSGDRDVTSLFAELSLPIIKNLETQLAARYDDYSDFGSSFTPKIGIKYRVNDAIAVRGTWAEGFRAPSLFQISSANVQAFNAGINDPLRCPVTGVAEDCNRTISTLIQANTALQPEESTSHTIGIIWSPSSDYSVAADYWYVHRTNFIDRFDSGTVIRNEFNPAFTGGTVQRDPNPASWLPGVPNSGPILSTIRRFDNFGGTAARGIDLDANGRFSLGKFGRLSTGLNLTYFDKMKWQLGQAGVPYINGAGNFYVYEAPRLRGVLSATWTYQAFDVLARLNHTGKWRYGDPDTVNECYLGATSATLAYLGRCYVRAWNTVDVGVTWKGIKNLTASVMVRNVGNIAAPYDPNQTTLGFNPSFHNPYGRYLQVGMSYKFK